MPEVAVVQIELDARGRVVEVLVAARVQAQVRHVLQAVEVRNGHGRGAGEIDRAALQRGGGRGLVGNEAHNQSVDVWLARVPVVRVALVDHVAAAHPFLEHEGAGTDRCLVGRVAGQVLALVHMPGNDGRLRGRERGEQEGRGLAQHQHGGMRIGRAHFGHAREGGAPARVRCLQREDGEGDVGRAEIAPVVPFHAPAQAEGVLQAVGLHLPRHRELGARAQVEVVAQKAFHCLGRDQESAGRGVDQADQRRRLQRREQGDHAVRRVPGRIGWRGGRRCGGCGGCERRCRQRQAEPAKQAPMEAPAADGRRGPHAVWSTS